VARKQHEQIRHGHNLDRQSNARQRRQRAVADHRNPSLDQSEDNADPDQRQGRLRQLRQHRHNGGRTGQGLECEPVDRRHCAQQRGDSFGAAPTIHSAGRDLARDAVIDANRRHHQIEGQGDRSSCDLRHYGGHERQAGSDRQSAAQQRARVDHEVEHDAEEIEPAHGPAVGRDRFDAELLNSGRLSIALPQRVLDLVSRRHARSVRVAGNVLFDPDRLMCSRIK
jgi:hypothetical protein